jgi:hypothetical protein
VKRASSGLKIARLFDLAKSSPGRGVKAFHTSGNWAVMLDEGEKGRLFEGKNWVIKFSEGAY